MSAPKKYRSKSNTFTYAYLGIFAFLALAIFWFDLPHDQIAILVIVLHIPAIIVPFVLSTYYIIGENNIVRKDINYTKPRMKDDPHSFLIPINAIDIIEHKSKAKGTGSLIFKNRDSQIPLGKITIEHADQFITELKDKKPAIQIVTP